MTAPKNPKADPPPTRGGPKTPPAKTSPLVIEGLVALESVATPPEELELTAYAFRPGGDFIGSAALDTKGSFSLAVKLDAPDEIELFIGPYVEDVQSIRQSSAFSQTFSQKDWQAQSDRLVLNPRINISRIIWWPWWPVRICVSGHVRKVHSENGVKEICPVPYVKVEVFDVDRENCWWPYISANLGSLLDRPVIRVPELVKGPFPPDPIPGPDPAPFLERASRVLLEKAAAFDPASMVSLNPQPLPPREGAPMELMSATSANSLVGEMAQVRPEIAAGLEKLTLTSKIPPWEIFFNCFYSRQLVCETTTDCDGFFRCCFPWWPFHFRRGRLRFDLRPDIIIRVTQVINGVTTVIYMDPYTSTRWNVTNTHIDLFLDNDEVVCGSPDCQDRPHGSPVFFTRIGDDEVYKINQADGLYSEGVLSNVAYGYNLNIYAQFGDLLSRGAPARYYRLSYARKTNPMVTPPDAAFTPLPAPPGGFSDTRVSKVGLISQTHFLGPQPVGASVGLYEVRNFQDYYWYNPDWLGIWYTTLAEENTGLYVLRLEVFDELGNKLNTASGLVDYRDGTVVPPAVLPVMIDHCDLVITLDNKGPDLDLFVPVTNDCGVIPWSPGLILNFTVHASQPNNRLRSVGFTYVKGVLPTVHNLAPFPHTSNNGLPGAINQVVSGASLLVGLSSTCAYALTLSATAHIRDGRNFIYYNQVVKAIAIEKCS